MWTFWGLHIVSWLVATGLAWHAYHTCSRVVDKATRVFMEDIASRIRDVPGLEKHLQLGIGHRASQKFTQSTMAIYDDFTLAKRAIRAKGT